MTTLNPWEYRAIFCLLALVAGSGCKHGHPAREEAAPSGPKRGDHIVIEQTAAEFFEARVLSVEGQTLQVQTSDGGEFRHVQTSDAYLLPPAPHSFSGGDLAICSPRPDHWQPCRVQRVRAERIDAVDGTGSALHLPRSRVLAPTALTRLDLRRYFERTHRRQAFSRAAAAAGRPAPPKGWRPQPHEHILALHDARWYSATIHEIDDDALRVRWRADSRVSELPYDSVVPAPPYNHELHRGDFVLARPTSLAAPWRAVEVVAANANAVQVADIDGDHRTLRPADVVPLGHSAAGGSGK